MGSAQQTEPAVPENFAAPDLTPSVKSVRAGVLGRAARDSFLKLNPFGLLRSPVLLVAECGALVVSLILVHDLWISGWARLFDAQIAIWLWLTVLFTNFGEAVARARNKARADGLRKSRSELLARRANGSKIQVVPSSKLRAGDVVVVEAGELIPVDGEIIEGVATVDESVITGESAPVIRASEGALSAVTRGTRVLSDRVKIRVLATPSQTFLDRMIAAVESSGQQQTGAEVALQSIIATASVFGFLIVACVFAFSRFGVLTTAPHAKPSISSFIALLICLLPTAIAGLLPAVGIAGITRLVEHKVLAVSRKIVESARDVKVVLLDKTGTITIGNREAVGLLPFEGVTEQQLAEVALLASIGDETVEGRSILSLAQRLYRIRVADFTTAEVRLIPFSAFTRMSGVDIQGRVLRKGAAEAIRNFVQQAGGSVPAWFQETADGIARTGGTPLAVAEGNRILGLIHLKDSVKPGIKEHMARLRSMGVRAVLITGDNPVTAQAIAQEIGMEEVLPQATPADKLTHIKREQAQRLMVAMTGDGINDAPALAQADIGLVMENGTTAAKDAGNMVGLDNDPAKIVDVVAIGRQIWVTRIALLVFSLTAGLVQCAVIVPAMLSALHPALARFNFLHLRNAESAVLAATMCNAILSLFLLRAALRGVFYRPLPVATFLRHNVIVYAVAAILIPLALMWGLDRLLGLFHLA
ncbi:MAG TPA: potassium-transporting ATPase subunit KdpB [Bryobacteraceae bacterium]|jgi:K+-transporting ATPase ATPase B chain|nr:potassium-transporting ATPase subunit KdpB [Bryobacteraceae bacterium]